MSPQLPKYQYRSNYGSDIKSKGWKPSIHMPKDACRLFLKVTDLRVERLHEISEAGAIAEGVNASNKYMTIQERANNYNNPSNQLGWSNKAGFEELWSKINGQKSWNENPFVWVISFQKCERPKGFC